MPPAVWAASSSQRMTHRPTISQDLAACRNSPFCAERRGSTLAAHPTHPTTVGVVGQRSWCIYIFYADKAAAMDPCEDWLPESHREAFPSLTFRGGAAPRSYESAVPAGAEPTPEKVALGDKLFNDKRVPVNDRVACATCHDPAKGFVDHKPLAEGVAAPAQRTQRNSPTVLNAMFNATQFWDGRAPTLEEQAKLPILNPIEMGQKSPDDVMNN